MGFERKQVDRISRKSFHEETRFWQKNVANETLQEEFYTVADGIMCFNSDKNNIFEITFSAIRPSNNPCYGIKSQIVHF